VNDTLKQIAGSMIAKSWLKNGLHFKPGYPKPNA
jgi:hypothetical protein